MTDLACQAFATSYFISVYRVGSTLQFVSKAAEGIMIAGIVPRRKITWLLVLQFYIPSLKRVLRAFPVKGHGSSDTVRPCRQA